LYREKRLNSAAFVFCKVKKNLHKKLIISKKFLKNSEKEGKLYTKRKLAESAERQGEYG